MAAGEAGDQLGGAAPIHLTRRRFLGGALAASALVLGATTAPAHLWAQALDASDDPLAGMAFHPGVWLGLEPSGRLTIMASRSEMGTGIRTALPRVLADEMDADWAQVRVVQAIGDRAYGSQDTDGSHSIRSFFNVMRSAGAAARMLLVAAAAQRWGVPAASCSAGLHCVVHPASGRKLLYGELAAAAAALPLPDPQPADFKPRSAWRYIGRDAAIMDLRDICTGAATYGIDVRRPGMLYAAIAHPPVVGGKVRTYQDGEARQVPGVSRIIELPAFHFPANFQPLGGVAVVADNTWAALEGRNRLRIAWDDGPNGNYDSAAYRRQLEATARRPGKLIRDNGDVGRAFAAAAKTVTAEYYAPHLAHAPMEPPAAVAEVRAGHAELWAPTQDPQGAQRAVAQALHLDPAQVICHVTLLGGAFGRKSMADFIVEAALLAQQTGRPVKVVWSREDDLRGDYYHSVAAMYLQAALDAGGRPTAWLGRTAFPPIGSTFSAGDEYGGAGELAMGFSDVPFAIPNVRVENGAAPAHLRIGWLRSVAHIYHAFAVQSFAAELAHAAGRDPKDYLLELLGPPRRLDPARLPAGARGVDHAPYAFDVGRLRKVTATAAARAGWGRKLPRGEGMGIAAHRSFLTYVATVVRVALDGQGHVRIRQVDTAVDAGTVVNPLGVRAQFEGAAVFGASLALYGEITAREGAVIQGNFDTYRVCRMEDAPLDVRVHIAPSTAPPAGVGEPGVPPFAPALCNAIFAATGRRVRALPLSRAGLA